MKQSVPRSAEVRYHERQERAKAAILLSAVALAFILSG